MESDRDSFIRELDGDSAKKALAQSRWSYIGVMLPLIGVIFAIVSLTGLKNLYKDSRTKLIVKKARGHAIRGLAVSVMMMVVWNGLSFAYYDDVMLRISKIRDTNNGPVLDDLSLDEDKYEPANVSVQPSQEYPSNSSPTIAERTEIPTQIAKRPPINSTSSPSSTTSTLGAEASSPPITRSQSSQQPTTTNTAEQEQAQLEAAAYQQCLTDKKAALLPTDNRITDLRNQLRNIDATIASRTNGYVTEAQRQKLVAQETITLNNLISDLEYERSKIASRYDC